MNNFRVMEKCAIVVEHCWSEDLWSLFPLQSEVFASFYEKINKIKMIILVMRLLFITSGFWFGSLVIWPSAINFVPFICQIIFSSVILSDLSFANILN